MTSDRIISVVDVGAAAIDSPPPYLPLLNLRLCEVVGFEPQTELWPTQTASVRIFPDIIGNGKPADLHIFNAPGMTSLFAPNRALLDSWDPKTSGGDRWGEVIETRPVKTLRLDDIAENLHIDFLKVDAQGSELDIIGGGRQKLSNAVCVHVEVSFVPLYHGQPLFGDVDYALRRLGLMFHTFTEMHVRRFVPYTGNAQPKQIIQGDAVYFRDLTLMDRMSAGQLERLATIAEFCYGSFDVAERCRQWLAKLSSPSARPETAPA